MTCILGTVRSCDLKKIKDSKYLRCKFFGEWKNLCSSKFLQLESLNKAKVRSSKIHAAYILNFLDPIQKRALSRSVQLEAMCLEALLYFKLLPNQQKFQIPYHNKNPTQDLICSKTLHLIDSRVRIRCSRLHGYYCNWLTLFPPLYCGFLPYSVRKCNIQHRLFVWIMYSPNKKYAPREP